MTTIPSALDKAKQLIEDYPYLFNQDLRYQIILQTAIASALLEYSIECDKANTENLKNEFESNLPPVFEQIFKDHKLQ